MAAANASRRAFLRGSVRAERPIRPPWSLDEPMFLDACTRCDACVRACPPQVLVRGSGGYPVFDPSRGECTFCGACAEACADKAIHVSATTTPWPWKADIALASCLAANGVVCASCQDGCPERAIHFQLAVGGVRTPIVDTSLCSGCGGCVSACPTSVITLQMPAEPSES